MTGTSAQIPQADPSAGPPPPPQKLYTVRQIGVAAFLGSILAAGWLARSNLMALGKERRGNMFFLGSVVAVLAVFGAGVLLPGSVPGAVFIIPQVMVAVQLARAEFGADVDKAAHHSSWRAAGIALLWMVLLMVLAGAIVFLLDALGVVEL